MVANRLRMGDEVRIISPARSLAMIDQSLIDLAVERLTSLGLVVTFSKNVSHVDYCMSASVADRVEDLHDAFLDENVKGILTVIGGFNANTIIDDLDFELIKANPKILCGFSDISILTNTIFHKTGLVTYQGPHFSSFGMVKGFDYTFEWFKRMLMEHDELSLVASETWSDDPWFMEQEKRNFEKNDGFWLINEGYASGTIVGGNLCTFNLLQGTEYMPVLYDTVLFLEDDEASAAEDFERNLQSLMHLPDFNGVCGIVIGRFQRNSKMSRELLTTMIKAKKKLSHLPIIANVDFGHTTPRITYPIGGRVSIVAKEEIEITIRKNR